jgi:demethylmenaquinone methyltransferase/2-methoxy-6-polyprenyl-1,4-benzoquinol methylase
MEEPDQMTAAETLLQEQIAYYRARAGEYDQWFLRQGRYDHGPEENQRWFAEAEEVAQALAAFAPTGRVLELACGTGLWTQHLARFASSITAVDSSPEVIAINGERLGTDHAGNVEYVQADLFAWQPAQQYDVVFFSFWLSHVPPERFSAFWEMVRKTLAPGGRVFFIDSLYSETSTASDHRLEGQEATTLTRRLNDGQEFRIVKVFYQPEKLAAQLDARGWQAQVQGTAHYFLYGSAQRRP